MSSRSMPRRRQPTLSPARPSSRSFLNISTPVTTTLRVGRMPTISTSSPTLTRPRSIRPVAPVPRPLRPKNSPTGRGGAPALGAEDVLDRHQERLVDRALGGRDVGVDRIHELLDAGIRRVA